MRTVDSIVIEAPLGAVFEAASQVERWPAILSHYRWVTILDAGTDRRTVEMAAWRPFGRFKWPTWWVSTMWTLPERFQVRYQHIRGVTRGMDVIWRLTPLGTTRTAIELTHEWRGPAWPLIRRPAARWVIGPIFVHGIASRTLAGIKRHLEIGHA